MRAPPKRIRPWILAVVGCALVAGGCRGPVVRIDPTGERFFLDPDACPEFIPEPGAVHGKDDATLVLTPCSLIAPVGKEVVLLAGVKACDGYLRTNRRIEWTIDGDGVGEFVDVGKNGVADLLMGDFTQTRKIDAHYAIGSTGRNYLRLTRGTPSPADDVPVLRGQAWITVTSPVEGVTHVTAMSPDILDWTRRKQSAVIHWVDASWAFPPPAINPVGTRHTFTTSVWRQSDQSPCAGWLVRYEIVDGPPAGFAPDGSQAVEVPTDSLGQAQAEIFQKEPAPGTNTIAIQVIRPAGRDGQRYVVDSDTTTKTWSAPDLAVEMTGPASAAVGSTIVYRIQVRNPGTAEARNVQVTDTLPQGLEHVASTPAALTAGSQLQWQLGSLAGGQTQTIELTCRAAQLGTVTNCAEATADENLKASSCATTTVGQARVEVNITGPERQAAVGDNVKFVIAVTNHGDQPATDLRLKVSFDEGLVHSEQESPIGKKLGEVGPNQSIYTGVFFNVTMPGELCCSAEVYQGDRVAASGRGCVTAVAAAQPKTPGDEVTPKPKVTPNGAAPKPIPKTTGRADVSVKKTGPPVKNVGDVAEFVIEVTNTGERVLTNLRIVEKCDPEFDYDQATPGHVRVGDELHWRLESLPVGEKAVFDVHCKCLKPATLARNGATVSTDEGARAEAQAAMQIRAAAVPQLSITATDTLEFVRVGETTTYVIRVTNNGQAPARQIVVAATVPAGMVPEPLGTTGPVLATGPLRWSLDERNRQMIRFEAVDALSAGQTLSYRVRAKAQQAGKVRFEARVTSQAVPQGIAAEEETDIYAEEPAPPGTGPPAGPGLPGMGGPTKG